MFFCVERIPLVIRHFCLPTNLPGIAQSSLSFEFINGVKGGAPPPPTDPHQPIVGSPLQDAVGLPAGRTAGSSGQGGTTSPGDGNDWRIPPALVVTNKITCYIILENPSLLASTNATISRQIYFVDPPIFSGETQCVGGPALVILDNDLTVEIIT